MKCGTQYGFLIKLNKDLLRDNYPEKDYETANKEIEEFFYNKWFNKRIGNLYLKTNVTETDNESYYISHCLSIAKELVKELPWVKECSDVFSLLEINKEIYLRFVV